MFGSWTTYGGLALAASMLGAGLTFPELPDLLATSGSGSTPPTSAQIKKMASLSEANATLRAGCQRYTYDYRISPPESQWSLETFLVGPKGERLGSDDILSGADPTTGTKTWTICKTNAEAGRFTVKGKFTYNDYPEQYSGWIQPTTFTLTK